MRAQREASYWAERNTAGWHLHMAVGHRTAFLKALEHPGYLPLEQKLIAAPAVPEELLGPLAEVLRELVEVVQVHWETRPGPWPLLIQAVDGQRRVRLPTAEEVRQYELTS